MMKKCCFWITVVLVVFFVWFSGYLLDRQAEDVATQLYHRNVHGVIDGQGSLRYHRQGSHALLLIHGFMDNPRTFIPLLDYIKMHAPQLSVYAPLLPYHGRNINIAAKLNNQYVEQFVHKHIVLLARRYQHLTVLGYSYGGAVVIALLHQHEIPSNVRVILYAPAVYLKSNTAKGHVELFLYSLWRKYCAYQSIGCDISNGSPIFKPIPAIRQLFALDTQDRQWITQIKRPITLIVAKDDNRVQAKQLIRICKRLAACTLHEFSSGQHDSHLTVNRRAFNRLVTQLGQQ